MAIRDSQLFFSLGFPCEYRMISRRISDLFSPHLHSNVHTVQLIHTTCATQIQFHRYSDSAFQFRTLHHDDADNPSKK